MLLSGIVISMGYTVLRIVQHEFDRFHNQSALLTSIYQLNEVLKLDLKNAEVIRFNINSSTLKIESFNRQPIKYSFMDNMIIRVVTKPDTFMIASNHIEVKKIDSLFNSPMPIISSISFDVKTPDSKNFPMHFTKTYPAKFFMESGFLTRGI